MGISMMRAGKRYDMEAERFWEFAKAGHLQPTDHILDGTGQFRPVSAFSELQGFLPASASPDRSEAGLGAALLKGALFAGGVFLTGLALAKMADALSGPPPRQKIPKWKQRYVQLRDNGRCVYCGVRVTRPNRHIDHYRSRANGGSDAVRNLVLACASCNLQKGALNGRAFKKLLSE